MKLHLVKKLARCLSITIDYKVTKRVVDRTSLQKIFMQRIFINLKKSFFKLIVFQISSQIFIFDLVCSSSIHICKSKFKKCTKFVYWFVQYYDFQLLKLKKREQRKNILVIYHTFKIFYKIYIFIDIKLENFKSMFKLRYT